MIKLDTTTRKIQAVLSGAVTANQLPCTVSYSDDNGTTYVGGTQLTNTNSTTAVDICAAPGASTVRDIDYLSIRNRDTAAATVTVMLDDNGTDYEIVKATLAVGDQLVYTHSDGWRALDANGNAKTSLSGATESQVQNSTLITLTSVSGTDTITAGAPDPFTAYANGQEFSFIAAGTNTGAVTLNIDSVGAIDIKKNGGTALSAGDITSGAFIKVKYVSATGDFEMMGGAGGGGVALSDNNTWTGTNTFRNAAGLRSEQAATQDAIALVGRAGGTGSYEATITPTTLTADRTITVPDASGTMAYTESGTWTVNLTSFGGTGLAATGNYVKCGLLVMWVVRITGTDVTSTANTSSFNLPFAASSITLAGNCVAANSSTVSYGVGVAGGVQSMQTPTWTATSVIVVSGSYIAAA